MNDQLDRTLSAAVGAGLLPPDATRPAVEERPWPLVLFAALGAWLAAVPLLLVVGALLGDLIERGAGPYVVGPLLIAAALVLLRSGADGADGGPGSGSGGPGWPTLFLEQLAVPTLLVGAGTLGYGLFRDLPDAWAAGALSVLALILAWLLPRPWLRVLCGAAAAALLALALHGTRGFWFGPGPRVQAWLALHGVLAVWLAGLGATRALAARGDTARRAAALEAVGAGWLTVTLAGLAFLSGLTLLSGTGLGQLGTELATWLGTRQVPGFMAAGSAALALAGAAAGAWVWPGLRRPWVLAVGAVIAVLAWFIPTLGGIWLALSAAALTHRRRLAITGALAAAWVIGAFYYQLNWTLAAKALVLAGSGAALAGLAWIGADGALRPAAARVVGSVPRGPAPRLIALTGIGVIIAANLSIVEKERLIADGRPVYVALAPVDPRSLMQGDYMRLAFRLPPVAVDADGGLGAPRPRVAARLDARGVADLTRVVQPGETLAEGEFPMELTRRNGAWTLVTDAWFFPEGEAERFAAARFGEFRVGPDGRALLVGLADAELGRLGP